MSSQRSNGCSTSTRCLAAPMTDRSAGRLSTVDGLSFLRMSTNVREGTTRAALRARSTRPRGRPDHRRHRRLQHPLGGTPAALHRPRQRLRRRRNRITVEHPRPRRRRARQRRPAAASRVPGHVLVRLGCLPTAHPHHQLNCRTELGDVPAATLRRGPMISRIARCGSACGDVDREERRGGHAPHGVDKLTGLAGLGNGRAPACVVAVIPARARRSTHADPAGGWQAGPWAPA